MRATLAVVSYPHWLAHSVVQIVRDNRRWMAWNLLLAGVPLVLALGLFGVARRRALAWWALAGAFVLLLPNAPYVVTDLVHLHEVADSAPSHSVVLAGVLPLFGAYIVAGYLSYVACLELLVREARRLGVRRGRRWIEIPVHAVCSVGIVLGRIARLNSWDTITRPETTVERIFATLSWSGAPAALVLVFLATWITAEVVRAPIVLVIRLVRRFRNWSADPPGLAAEPGVA